MFYHFCYYNNYNPIYALEIIYFNNHSIIYVITIIMILCQS